MGIEENIVPGKILYLNVCFPHEEISHDKYLVVAGIDGNGNPVLLKINSKNLKPQEFCVKSTIYTFLDYDSYLDCGSAWCMLLTMGEIIEQLERDSTRIKGELTGDHRNETVRRVRLSNSISPKNKKIIIEALSRKNPT